MISSPIVLTTKPLFRLTTFEITPRHISIAASAPRFPNAS